MRVGPIAILQRGTFRTFGAMPKPLRRLIIRTIRPTWTAGAVAVIERDDGRWLFVRPVYRKGWTLPGGLVDRGEQPAATVVREMREELGIDVVITTGGWVIVDSGGSQIETVFRARLASGTDPDEIEITTAELLECGWFRPDSPPDTEHETDDILALVRQVEAGGSEVLFRTDDTS